MLSMESRIKNYIKSVVALTVSWVLVLVGFIPASASSVLTDKGYQLEQVVMMSRHNLRTPLSGKGSIAEKMTSHQWHQWSIQPGHLTLKGAINETAFGQYYRCYLEDEGFMPVDWVPQEGEVSFYANSFQRTIATAKYFSSGMLPVANVHVVHTKGIDEPDPVFFFPLELDTPRLYELGVSYTEQNMPRYLTNGEAMLASFEKVMDFSHSEYAREKGIEHLDPKDVHFVLGGKDKNVPGFKGSWRDAYKATDALIMQYYEEPDNNKADWGTGLTKQDWKNIGDISTRGISMICENPALSLRYIHSLLEKMDSDLSNEDKRFSFFCGHDTNIIMLMTVLGAEDYHVPGAIADKAPIGCKIVLEKRRDKDGELYINPYIIYQSDRQIRHCEVLDLNNPPLRYPIKLTGIEANEDGLYRYSDFKRLLQDIHAQYAYYTET